MAHRKSNASCRSTRQSLGRPLLHHTVAASVLATLAGCGSVASVSHSLFSQSNTILSGYVGTVVADEPEAALAGRDVLAHGGNAADAATTTALALSVTLPSRASLGGGGACLAYRPNEAPHAFLFLPVSAPKADGTRAAAIPMTPRGLFLMQLHYGSVEFADTLAPAIRLARNGITVSRAFGKDLGAVHNALFADEAAQETFTRPDGSVLQNGDSLTQPRLANFLERLGNVGVGDLYNGALAGIFVEGAADAGGGIDTQSLRNALPAEGGALKVSSGTSTAYFLPPPADGGYGAANMIRNGGSAQSAVAMWRASHPATGNTTSLIAQAQSALEQGTSGSGTLPALPASTSFVVTDSHGGAVACALTNNNLFGTGRMAEGTGVLLAASPAAVPQPLLGASIVLDRGMLQGAAASSGQNAAADALASATRAIMTGSTIPHDGAGRVNATSCTNNRCIGDTDPRGAGLATGSIGN